MNKDEAKLKTFETSELCLAVTLLYAGYPLELVLRASPKSVFVFSWDPHLDQLIQSFWTGLLQVEPKRWFACQREIKSRLYNQ